MAEINWQSSKSPLLLSQIVPELKLRNIDYHAICGKEKIKSFALRTQNQGEYRMVMDTKKSQFGIVPALSSVSASQDAVSATVPPDNFHAVTLVQAEEIAKGAQEPSIPAARERAPLTLKPRVGGGGVVKQSFAHGRSKTVVVETKRRINSPEKSLEDIRREAELAERERIIAEENDREVEARQRAIQAALVEQKEREVALRRLRPVAVEGVPSVFGYTWSKNNTIVLEVSSSNIPRFPFPSSERDHHRRLEASRMLAEDLIGDLDSRKFNVRSEYCGELKKYATRLPIEKDVGNILLADAAARTLRDLFANDADILPVSMAAKLKIVLEQHIGLRAYYPEIENFYRDVQSGRLQEPLPLDAIDGVVQTVQIYTPEIFDPSVVAAIDESAKSNPPASSEEIKEIEVNQPLPPPDPLGNLDPSKAHDFQVAGVVNKLWQVFTSGEKVQKAVESWQATHDRLAPYVAQVLEWLEHFLSKSS